MEIGILGLASSGKTTLFSLLTGQDPAAVAAARGATSGIARVPDDRLDQLSNMFQPKKHTPATIQYVDVPGIPAEHGREGSLNIPELRTMDVLMVVLRAFSSEVVPHPLTTVDPRRDLDHIEEEFLLQDLMVVEKRLERLAKDLAKRKVPDLEAERDVLERCRVLLEDSQPLRSGEFSNDELKRLRGFTFLSLKPLLAILNLDESDIGSDPLAEAAWAEVMARPRVAGTSVCATLESEIEQLGGDDATAFMEDLGLTDRALNRVIQESYRLLGLISFFTVGDDECRAWSIRQGTPAVEAAGAIHSDIQRGFIRAEVVRHEELLDQGSLANCRQAGSLRLEGKTYTVADGDVIHFRFNV
jgi:GTP-binding protein YchF